MHGLHGFARGCVKKNYRCHDFQEGLRDAGDLLGKHPHSCMPHIPVYRVLTPSEASWLVHPFTSFNAA